MKTILRGFATQAEAVAFVEGLELANDSALEVQEIVKGDIPFHALRDKQGIRYLWVVEVTDIDCSEESFECQDCGREWEEDDLYPVEDISERVAPGEPMPSGECPWCGAVCHPVEDTDEGSDSAR